MAQRVEGLSIDLDLNTAKLDRGLKGAKDSLKSVNSEMKSNMSAFDRGDKSIEKYETSLKGLNKKLKAQERVTEEARKEYKKITAEYSAGSKEVEKATRDFNKQAAALNNLDRYVNDATEELEGMRKEQKRANSGWGKLSGGLDEFSSGLDKAGGKMSSFGQTMSASVTAPIIGMGALAVESTREFRVNMARLETNAKDAGIGIDVVNESMRELNGVTGETDSNVEALSNLMATGMDSNQMQKAIDDLSGAVIKFPDTLKIESLADGLQETLATGKAIGPFSELIERMGVDLETFDKGLANAKESGGELDYALNQLNKLDLSKVSKEFKDTNEEIVNARNAQYDFQESFAELGKKLEPIASELTNRVTDIVDVFNELDSSTQDNIVKFAGLSAAVGPASVALGGATTAISNMAKGGSKLTGMLGKKGGKGVLGRIAGLSRGGVVGLAIGGVAALGAGVYALAKESDKMNDINIETAKSFSDQASELKNNVTAFEDLSDKAKISNDQLAEMNDLNKRISESANPGEIRQLKDRYNDLAKESGLSKEQIEKLFEANDSIIEQSPNVEKAVSEQGNAFAEATDAVKDQIEALRDLSEKELKGNRAALLEQEAEAREIINKKTGELENKEKRINLLYENRNKTNDEIEKRVEVINEKLSNGVKSDKKSLELKQERSALLTIEDGQIAETIEKLQTEKDAIQETVDKEQAKIDKLSAVNKQMSNIYLQNVGINKTGEKGLVQLDKSISKNQKEIEKIESKREAGNKLGKEEIKRLDTLKKTVNKQESARLQIFRETELYSNLNSLADARLEKIGLAGRKKVINLARTRDIDATEGNIVKKMQTKNKKLLEERTNLIENLKKNGANKDEIKKQISALDTKVIKNDVVMKSILQELGIWKDVKNTIDLGSNGIENQNTNMDKSNRKLLGLQGDAERYTAELRKDVTKNMNVNEYPSISTLDRMLGAPVNKTVSLRTIGLSSLDSFYRSAFDISGHAAGTHDNPGGMSMLGGES